MVRTVKLTQPQLRRRLDLLDGMIAGLLSSGCGFFACDGPVPTPTSMATCHRCWALHRAIRSGLVTWERMKDGGVKLIQVSARTEKPMES